MESSSVPAISKRGQRFIPEKSSPLLDALIACARNPYSSSSPSGLINAGTAENHLSSKSVLSAIVKQSTNLTEASLKYDAFEGSPAFRAAVAAYLQGITLGQLETITADQIVTACGCGTALNNVMLTIAEHGDGVIIPTPCYGALPMDTGVLAGLEMVSAPMKHPFEIQVDSLETSYQTSISKNIRPTVLLLTCPDNPTGRVMTGSQLVEIYQWAKSHDLHIVCDEIYANSVFEGEFVSILRAIHDAGLWNEEYAKSKVHVVYGFAKDLSASGLRTGVIFSRNTLAIKALSSISPFFSVSGPTQALLTCLLTDSEWISNYVQQNKSLLRSSYGIITRILNELNVPFIPASGGLFITVDLRKFLREATSEAETHLFNHIFAHKLYITPGSSFFFPEPGFFRVIFAHSEATLAELGRRLGEALRSYKNDA